MFSEEDFQEPFSSKEFVENLARKALASRKPSESSTTSTSTSKKESAAGKQKDREKDNRKISSSSSSSSNQSNSNSILSSSNKELKDGLKGTGKDLEYLDAGEFTPQPLIQLFKDGIGTLAALSNWIEDKIQRLETSCQEAERKYRQETLKLNQGYQIVVNGFYDLDDRIQKVAAKAVHLGNRLETANLKRTRALEAQELMNLFRAFDEPGKISTLLPRSRTKTETNRKIRVDSDSSERGNNIDQYDNNSNDNDANNDNDNDNDNSNENDKDENDKGGKGASDGNEESTTDLVTQSKQLSIKGWQSKINTLFFSEMSNIHQAADLIQKLDFLAQELSFSDKYALAKERIDITYANIESRLHEKFALARGAGNVEEMKHIANTLYPFRNYNLCIETFVNLHRFFKGTSADFSSPLRAGSIFTDKDVFDDMANECIKEFETIKIVFRNPEYVMSKFAARIFEQKLSNLVENDLKEAISKDYSTYLNRLDRLYEHTNEMVKKISQSFAGADFPSLVDSVFFSYLSDYIRFEELALEMKYNGLIQHFYDSIHHNRKDLSAAPAKGLLDKAKELKEKLQANAPSISFFDTNPFSLAFGGDSSTTSPPSSTSPSSSSTTSSSISPSSSLSPSASSSSNNGVSVSSSPNDTLLSIELALSLLHLNTEALNRCQRLSSLDDLPGHTQIIFSKLLAAICTNHIGYALDHAQASLPSAEPRSEPSIQFLNIVHISNYIFHLVQGHFRSHILPVVSLSFTAHSASISEKNTIMAGLEAKISSGLERVLDSVSFWLEKILDTEQKRTDFRPDENDVSVFNKPCTAACQTCVQYLSRQRDIIIGALDGRNLEIVLSELGIRFHQIILDHLKKFIINSLGGLILTRDIAEYQTCIRKFNVPLLNELFETLRELSAIFLMKPENLRQVCSEGLLAQVDRETIMTYVQLRADFKTARIGRFF